jgi:hypothetical protein
VRSGSSRSIAIFYFICRGISHLIHSCYVSCTCDGSHQTARGQDGKAQKESHRNGNTRGRRACVLNSFVIATLVKSPLLESVSVSMFYFSQNDRA